MKIFIYENITDFKTFVGGGVNLSIEQKSIEPIMRQALFEHIIPWLGEKFWEEWSEEYSHEDTTSEGKFQPFIQRALAFVTLHEYSKIAGVMLGENGFFRVESESYKSLFKYQENEYKDFMLHNGYEALEEAIKFLEKNEADFQTWTDSPEHEDRIRTLFLNHASEFRRVYSKQISRYTFEILRPIIEDIETFAILPLLGQAFFDELKTAIKVNDLSPVQKKLIRHIQKALANFAIKDGIKSSMVRLKGNKIIQSEKLEPQSYEKESIPSLKSTDIKIRYQDEVGNRFISYIKKYLLDNLDEFPTYQTYLEELATAEEETTQNERLPCGCNTTCSCTQNTKGRSIIRL